MEDVSFLNCSFEITQQPKGKDLAKALLAHNPIRRLSIS
jgi:hypothetical protein